MASIITPSSIYDNNFSTKAYTSEIIAKSLTDGTATFANGTIINLVYPINPQDAISKGFVDGLVDVAPPTNSVQFNNLTFAGSGNLTFVPSTLTVNGIINDGSGISITEGIISGLNDPTLSDQIATKNYVDSISSITSNNYIQSDIGVTYTASQMINSVILRNLSTYNNFGISLTDTTASAANLVALVPNASIGYAAKFRIMNDNPDANGTTVEGRDGFVLTINPGTGVTFYPNNNFNLRKGYMLEGFIQFTNVITPAVTIIITRCGYSGTSFYLVPTPASNFTVLNNVVDYLNYTSTILKGNLLWNVNDTVITDTNYSYTTSNVKNQLTVRNPAGNSSDILGYNIDIKYMNQIMTIQNQSAFTIDIDGQTDIWNLIPSTITIPSHNQAIVSFRHGGSTLDDAGSYYNYGSYNTSGGTGTGLTLTVIGLGTTINLISAGTTYTVGDYTTTNLTTPSATGLVIDVNAVDGMGAITAIRSIVNFLNGGYQDGDLIQINGGDETASFQLILVNSITGILINTLGNGEYLSTDTLDISGPGTGSGAQITLGSFITVRTIGIFPL